MEHGYRAVAAALLGAVALVGLGVWGVANLAAGDWFIGGAFVVCAVLCLRPLASAVGRLRRQ